MTKHRDDDFDFDEAARNFDDGAVTAPKNVKDLWSDKSWAGGVRREGVFVTVLAGEKTGRKYSVGDELVIGRDEGVDLRLDETDVSRRHARVFRGLGGEYQVEDLNSRNGTQVNGEKVSKRKLTFGDRIRIGGSSLLLFNYRDHREEEQQEAQRMEALGRLAGGIAHDFNNLLAAMMSNIGLVRELLRDVDGVDEVVGDCLRDVASASERASALTSQLLGFARRGKYEERPTDISALAHDVLRLVRRTFDKKIEVKDQVAPALYVIGDQSQLHQALMNLCINARDAMPDGGELTISVREVSEPGGAGDRSLSGPHVLITVRDTGVGLDAEAKDRLFEPFFTTKQTGHGTGLGLAMVYGIVQNHLGKVWVESAPGQGASFFLALPLVRAPTTRPGVIPEETMKLRTFRQIDPAAHTILVVDDEPMVRESIRRTLEHLGYPVLFAKDGVEALEQYRAHGAKISLVMLDLIMPRMGGEQTLRELKVMNPDVKVLITTGYNEDERTRAVRESGIVGFLPKPFNAQSLNAAISQALLG